MQPTFMCVDWPMTFALVMNCIFGTQNHEHASVMISNNLLVLGATAADALSIGYRTILIDDCCRGVDLNDIEQTKNSVIKNHGVIVQSNEVHLINHYIEYPLMVQLLILFFYSR